MSKPVLTVCLITYNQKKYVREAVDTILAQKINVPWELVIADDYSTDGTRQILQDYKKNNPGVIKLILQDRNVGPEKNWLDLIAYPKSKYVAYTEGDDYYTDPTKLQRQIDYLESHEEASLCFHPVNVVYEDKSHPDKIFPTPEQRENKKIFGTEDILKSNFIQTNSVMYRWRFINESVKDVFPMGIAPGDWFLHILHARNGKIGFIDRVMSVYRRHAGGIWWQSDNDIDEIWKKYGIQHYKLYVEMLKLYGDDTESKKIIYKHIADKLDTFIDVDKRHSNHLVKSIIEMFPETVEEYVVAQHQTNISREHTILIKDAELAKIHAQLGHLELMLSRKNQEVSLIKASRIWKLRNRVAKLIGKKPV